jgi:phage terminase Nu1 subunit (DNA packaging protein)
MAAQTQPVTVIAKLLLLTPRRVQQLSKEGVIPRAEKGRYELVPAVQGYIRYLHDRAFGKDVPTCDLVASKERLVKAQAKLAEIQLAEKEGKVVPTDIVRRSAFETGRKVREAMKNISPRIESILAAEGDVTRVRAILDREIDAALADFADELDAAG